MNVDDDRRRAARDDLAELEERTRRLVEKADAAGDAHMRGIHERMLRLIQKQRQEHEEFEQEQADRRAEEEREAASPVRRKTQAGPLKTIGVYLGIIQRAGRQNGNIKLCLPCYFVSRGGWSMPDEVRVDPALLDSGARVSADLRGALSKDVTDVEPETVRAAQQLAGWSTGRAAEDLVWFWRDDLTKLGASLDALVNGLAAYAGDYRQSDRASADNFRAVG